MQHFVKQPYEHIWHFMYTEKSGICFCKMKSALISKYEVLLENGQPDFDVCVDNDGVIHLACQDDGGNIIYLMHTGDTWHKSVLLQSKNPEPYPKNFCILQNRAWVNLFYIVNSQGKRLLTHHILNNTSSPDALDYIDGEYFAVQDKLGNNYVFYNNGYRKYQWNRKEWSDFIKLYDASPYPFVDGEEKIHLVIEESNEIKYIGNGAKQSLGKGEKPIMFQIGSILWIMWKDSDRILAAYSGNSGGTWLSNGEFMSGRTCSSELFKLSCTENEKNLSVRHCYGYISDNAAKLYLINNFFQTQNKPTTPQIRVAGQDVQDFAAQYNKEDATEITKLKIQFSSITEHLRRIEKMLAVMENGIKKLLSKGE